MLMIIVGGHAANFWGEFYSQREPRLRALLPFVSKDLDLIGSAAEAAQVAERIGWHLSPPLVGGGPVQVIVSSEPGGGGLAADFLSQIKGVSYQTIVENARDASVRVPQTHENVAVRVLDPVLLLAGKIRNAVDIQQDQPDRPRQDVKHVAMLALCVPRFLEDMQARAVERVQQLEVCGKYITMLAALKNTYSGRQFEVQHPGIVHWPELIPETVRRLPFEGQIQNSLRQLGSQSQSRDMRI